MSNSQIEYLNDEEYCQKLLTAYYACGIADLNEPETFTSSPKFKNGYHGIKRIAASLNDIKMIVSNRETLKTEIVFIETRHIICDYSSSSRKRLAVAVTLIPQSKFPFYFYNNINETGPFAESSQYEFEEFNYINSSVVEHGSRIPIEYLRNKWLKEGYEILFTGFGFGAAIAAFLAVRLLFTSNQELNETDEKRILFIGFSCPLFVGQEFRNFIKMKKYENMFHFYREINDAQVNFRDLQTIIGISYSMEKSELNTTIITKFSDFFEYYKTELSNIRSSYILKGFPAFDDEFNLTKSIAYDLINIYPKEIFYINFGICFQIGEAKIEDVITLSWVKTIMDKKYDVYGFALEMHIFKNLCIKKKDIYESIGPIMDIRIPNGKPKFVDLRNFYNIASRNDELNYTYYWHKTFEFIIGISCPNMHSLCCAEFGFDTKIILAKGVRYDKNSVWLTCSYSHAHILPSVIPVKLNTFFEKFIISCPISDQNYDEIMIKDEKNIDKKTLIYKLPIDMLYIHAFFFIQTVLSLKNNTKVNESLLNDYESIMKIFDRLDEIIKSFSSKIVSYSKKDDNYVKMMFKQQFTLKKYEDFLKNFDFNFEWNQIFKITFKDIINKLKSMKIQDRILYLLKYLFPKVYSLKRAQVEFIGEWTLSSFYSRNDIKRNLNYEDMIERLSRRLQPNPNKYLNFDICCEEIVFNYWIRNYRVIDESIKVDRNEVECVVSNFKMRQILAQNNFIGVIGLRNVGKTRFVKIITGTIHNDLPYHIETNPNQTQAYSIVDDLTIFDYQHHNSDSESYTEHFEYSKFLLNYAFVIFDTTQIGKTLSDDQQLLIRDLRAHEIFRFCIVFNHFDKMWIKQRDRYAKMSDFGRYEIEKLKEKKKMLIINKLKEIDEENNIYLSDEQYSMNIKVIMTCMEFKHIHMEDRSLLTKANILSGQDVQKKALKVLIREITNENVKCRLKEKLEYIQEHTNTKTCSFNYKSQNWISFNLTLTRNLEPDRDMNDLKSFDELNKSLKDKFMIRTESIVIKTLSKILITKYDEIFQRDDHVFEVHDASSKNESSSWNISKSLLENTFGQDKRILANKKSNSNVRTKDKENLKSIENTELENILNQDYYEKLVTATIACRIVDLDEPESLLTSKKSKYNFPGIKKMCASKILTIDTFGIEIESIKTRHVICDFSNQAHKRLVISVTFIGDSTFPIDFYKSINDFGPFAESSKYKYEEFNYINSSVVDHGSRIPIGYLRDKWLKQDYEILFTGFGFGAAIAAFLAVRLLTSEKNENINEEKNKSIMFIGFSCPLFAGQNFKEFIETKYKNQFQFYRDKNDAEVIFRDLQTLIGISDYECRKNRSDINLVTLRFEDLFKFHQDQLSTYSKYYIEAFSQSKELFEQFECMSNICDLINFFPKEKIYVDFGLSIEICNNKLINTTECNIIKILKDKSNGKISLEKYSDKILELNDIDFNIELTDKIESVEDIKIPCFNLAKFVNYKEFYKRASENKEFKEFYFTVIVIKKEHGNDVYLGISCRNMYNIFCASANYKSVDKILSNEIRYGQNSMWFGFSYPELMDSDTLEIELSSFYDSLTIKSNFTKKDHEKFNIFEHNDDKISTIYKLDIDILYIHAIFFIQTIETLKNNLIKTSQESKIQLDGDEALLSIFNKIDEILNSSHANIIKTKKEEEYAKAMYERFCLNDKFIKNLNSNNVKEEDKIDEYFLNKLDWSSKTKFQTILDKFKNKDAYGNDLIMQLLIDLIPKVYYLKRRQVEKIGKWLHIFKSDVVSYYQKFEGVMSYALQRAKWYYYNDIEENHKYEYMAEKIAKTLQPESSPMPYLGCFEEIAFFTQSIFENIEQKFKLDQKQVDCVVNNFKIRQILAHNNLIGVIGLKKAGKSSFVELITNTKDISSAMEETKSLSAYRIVDDLILFDYPHHNSGDGFYRVQFQYSKFMLNLAFLVLDIEQIGDTLINDLINLLRDLRGKGMCRVCVVLNKFDRIFENVKQMMPNVTDVNLIKSKIEQFKQEKVNVLIKGLRPIDEENNLYLKNEQYEESLNVIMTCLNFDKMKADLGYMAKVDILYGDNLKQKIYEILSKEVKKYEEKLEELRRQLKKTKKECIFRYRPDKKINISYTEELEKSEKSDDSKKDWLNLMNILKSALNIKIDSFSIKASSSPSIITSYDQFFDCDDEVFEIVLNT